MNQAVRAFGFRNRSGSLRAVLNSAVEELTAENAKSAKAKRIPTIPCNSVPPRLCGETSRGGFKNKRGYSSLSVAHRSSVVPARETGFTAPRAPGIMKFIFSSLDASQLSRFKTMMGQADIPCVIRNSQLDLPMPLEPLETELWVVNDADCSKASDLVKGWSHS